MDLDLFDVPMDYQILTLGDYYQEPSIPIEQITYQYTVVPATFSFPTGIPYTLLASIHIPSDTRVEAETERLAGLTTDGDDVAGTSPLQVVTPNNAIVCPTGYHYDFTTQACVLNSCQTGYHWDTASSTCISDTPGTPTYPGLPPAGTLWFGILKQRSM